MSTYEPFQSTFSRTIRLTLAYDGTDFHGWAAQKNPEIRTVQGVLSHAVERISAGVPFEILGSSRTDAGVHALGQTAALWTDSRIPVERIPKALNANLPEDVYVLGAEEMPGTYHPLRSVRRKRYRYLLLDSEGPELFLRRYVWWLGRAAVSPLNVQAMAEAAEVLRGTHDFAAFQNVGSPREDTVRTVFDIQVTRGVAPAAGEFPLFPMLGDAGNLISIEVEADGFLYNMVRNFAGSLMEVGRKNLSPEWMKTALESKDRANAGPTAPPQGLFLLWTNA